MCVRRVFYNCKEVFIFYQFLFSNLLNEEKRNMKPEEYSNRRRFFILFIGFTETLIFSGVLFGWADLVYLMKLEGIFSTKCIQEMVNNITATLECSQQDNLFDLAFTLATFSKGSMLILIGLLLDHFGLRISRLLANIQIVIGGYMIGYSTTVNPYLLFPGTLLVGFGGSQVRMNSFVIANLFPNHKSTVISLYNGAFSASAAVFLLFKYIHRFDIDIKSSFVLWSGVSGLMIVPTMFLLPGTTIQPSIHDNTCLQDIPDETTQQYEPVSRRDSLSINSEVSSSLETSFMQSAMKKAYGTTEQVDTQSQTVDSPSIQKSFLSTTYILHLYWSCVVALAIGVYSGNFNRWVDSITTNKRTVSEMMELYGICQLPMVVVAPLGGMLLDYGLNKANEETDPNLRRKKAYCSGFWFLMLTTLIQLLQIICMFFNSILAVKISLYLYIFSRPMVNAATVVHLRISFPSDHFNRLLGVLGTLTAIFSLVQFPLFVWAGNNSFAANMLLTVMTVMCFSNAFNLLCWRKRTVT